MSSFASILNEELASSKTSSKRQKIKDQAPTDEFDSDHVDELIDELLEEQKHLIYAVGVGGGGTNAIDRLSRTGPNGAVTVAINTDAKHLKYVLSDKKVVIGRNLTRGLGAGNDPNIGKLAAEESYDDLLRLFRNTDIAFITTGLGGGTGTGAAPIVAKAASEAGALVVSVVTLPFEVEGETRVKNAMLGLKEIYKTSNTVIVIPNQRLMSILPGVPVKIAFKVVDEILIRAVKGITNLIQTPQFINVDYNDIKTVLKVGGSSVIGTGTGEGPNKIQDAINEALSNSLLEMDLMEAKASLISITGGESLPLEALEEVINIIGNEVGGGDALKNLIWGYNVDENLGDKVTVTVILSGVSSPYDLSFTEEEIESAFN